MTRIILLNEPTTQNPHYIEELTERRPVNLRSRRFVAYDTEKNSITGYTATLRTGVKHNTNHRWFRWFTASSEQIRVTKRGHFTLRTMFTDGVKNSSKRFHSDHPGHWRIIQYENGYLFNRFAKLIFDNDFTVQDVYPMARQWEITNWYDMPSNMPALKESDPYEFINRVFGKKNYRKDLVKAAFDTQPFIINFASQFRNYVPTDWLIEFMRNHKNFVTPLRREAEVYDLSFSIGLLRKAMPLLTQQEMRNLLRQEMTNRNIFLLRDTIERGVKRRLPELDYMFGYGRIHVPRIRNFQNLHDIFWPNAVRQGLNYGYIELPPRPNLNTEIPVTPVGKAIAQRPYMILPKTIQDLYDWSNYMHNCISGYAPDVVKNNSSIVLGAIKYDVAHDGKIIANFEVRNNRLMQLLGKHNQILPDDLRKMLEFEFREAGVVIPEYYWGMPAIDAPENNRRNDGADIIRGLAM